MPKVRLANRKDFTLGVKSWSLCWSLYSCTLQKPVRRGVRIEGAVVLAAEG